MAYRAKTAYKALYGNSGSQFPDNTTELITEGTLRSFGEDTADSFWQTSVTNPAISAGTVDFNFQSCEKGLFVIATNLSSATAVTISSTSFAREFTFIVNVTNLAGILTFPAGFIMSDARWEEINPQEFIFTQTGKYKGHAWYDGTNWILDIAQAPYV